MPSMIALNIDLPSCKNAVANRADALVIERIPIFAPRRQLLKLRAALRAKSGFVSWSIRFLVPGKVTDAIVIVSASKAKKMRMEDVKMMPTNCVAIGPVDVFAATGATI
jgi:hypothetical protein